jgi:hypothetical protein
VSDKKKKPKHALLIWNEIPEKVSYFLIPLEDLEKTQRAWLRRCHGNYVNAAGTTFNGKFTQKQIDKALIMICEMVQDPNADWLVNDPEYYERQAKQYKMDVDEFTNLHGSWFGYKIRLNKPAIIPRCRLVESGIYL